MSTGIACLEDMALRINAAHERVLIAATEAVDASIEVGRLLTEAKAEVPHGGWIAWVNANCVFGDRQASKYLRCWRERDAITEAIRTAGNPAVGIDRALALLAPPKPESTTSVVEIGIADSDLGEADPAFPNLGKTQLVSHSQLAVNSPAPIGAGRVRDLCDRSRAEMESIAGLLAELKEGRGWEALGYGSWEECVEAEFGGIQDLCRFEASGIVGVSEHLIDCAELIREASAETAEEIRRGDLNLMAAMRRHGLEYPAVRPRDAAKARMDHRALTAELLDAMARGGPGPKPDYKADLEGLDAMLDRIIEASNTTRQTEN